MASEGQGTVINAYRLEHHRLKAIDAAAEAATARDAATTGHLIDRESSFMEAHALRIPVGRLQLFQALRLAKLHSCEFDGLGFESTKFDEVSHTIDAAIRALQHRQTDAAMLIRRVVAMADFERALLFSLVCTSIDFGLKPWRQAGSEPTARG